ncbi:unnamed protein product, partial [Prunus brigantina]
IPSTLPFLLFPFCPFSFSLSFQRTYQFIVDFELAGWGAAMEDFRSLLEMLWRPLIFVWGVELRIQRPFRFIKLSVRCDIFHRFCNLHLRHLSASSCVLCHRVCISSPF